MTTAETALRARDPGWMEWTVPLLWPALNAWFRPQVLGLDRIPPHGPVLLVGNHSGGNVAPDTLVFATAFTRRFGTRGRSSSSPTSSSWPRRGSGSSGGTGR